MKMYQLPDGTWATTAVFAGIGFKKPCPGDAHQWEDKGTPNEIPEGQEAPEGMKMMHFQVCKKCTWSRVQFTKGSA